MQFIEQKIWIAENFPRDRRYENLIFESENVLTADTIRYVSPKLEKCIRYTFQFIMEIYHLPLG